MVQQIAQQQAQCAGKHTDPCELDHVTRGNRALGQAQHAQHGAIVQMRGSKSPRCQGHGHRAEQGRQERDQTQKLARAIQRLAEFGPPTLQRLQAHAARSAFHAALDVRSGPHFKGLGLGRGTGQRHAVIDAAGGLDQAGGGHVRRVEHHARGEVHEGRALVRLLGEYGGNRQAAVAQQQRLPGRDTQRIEQLRLDPHGARLRNTGLHRVTHRHG